MTSALPISNCFTWNTKTNKVCNKETTTNPLSEIPELGLKYIYDKGKEDTLSLFIVCKVLEKVYHLGAVNATTVKDVKEHIKRLENVPIYLLLLFFKGVLLSNSQILKECGVKHRDKLVLKVKLHTAKCEQCTLVPGNQNRWIKLTLVSITGRAFQTSVPVMNTIDTLKEVVERSFKASRSEVLLLYSGINLEDDMTFEEYGITTDKNILLIFYEYENCGFCGGCAKAAKRPTIALHYFHNVFVCLLQPQQSVQAFKDISYRYLHHVHPDLQQIFYKNEELDDAKTLCDYAIKDGDDLFVKLNFKCRTCDVCKGTLN